MKAIIFVLFSLIVLNVTAQKHKATFYLFDGTIKEGYTRYPGFATNLKYWETEDSKPEKYSVNELDKLVITVKGKERTYIFRDVLEYDHTLVLEELIVGRISTYRSVFTKSFYGHNNPIYFLKRTLPNGYEEIVPTWLIQRKFKKTGAEYFKDCPEISSKIKNKEYKRKDLFQVVVRYNTYCK